MTRTPAIPPRHRSPYPARKREAIDSELRGEAQPDPKNAARDRPRPNRPHGEDEPPRGDRGARVRKRLDLMAMLYGIRRGRQ